MMNNNFSNNPALQQALAQNQAQANVGFNPAAAGFGTGSNGVNNNANNAERKKATVWLNVGYPVNYVNDAGETETTFVSLPVGIALDTVEPVAIRGRKDTNYAKIQAAKNALLEQLLAVASGLGSGEATVLDPGALSIEIRKVHDESDVSTDVEGENPFLKNILG